MLVCLLKYNTSLNSEDRAGLIELHNFIHVLSAYYNFIEHGNTATHQASVASLRYHC